MPGDGNIGNTDLLDDRARGAGLPPSRHPSADDKSTRKANEGWPLPHWAADRWDGIRRDYGPSTVATLAGSIRQRYTLAEMGAEKLWRRLHGVKPVRSLGATTGGQAVQHVRAGLEAIYLSGWQVAADANTAGKTYPDQSLYPADSVPSVVRRINNALLRADQIQHMEKSQGLTTTDLDFLVPIVADAEAGFGGPLNAFELMKAMIEAGAAGVHFEDQLASEKKCGHMGGKVLVPTSAFLRTLTAARLAADVMGVPTLLLARTDAQAAKLLTSDIDEVDRRFITGQRTVEGFYQTTGGLDYAIARGLAYAPYADLIWCETDTPNIEVAREFATAIRHDFPGKLLAYNCSPSFNWAKYLTESQMASFQEQLGEMGYMFQFVTLAGFHSLNLATFDLARAYAARGMAGYSELQQREFAAEADGYTATRHQREVGTSYFDEVTRTITAGRASTTAMTGSTEAAQF
jgi:isocitrate lyase